MRKLSVLIADDDEALRAVLRFVVESRGHRVTEAGDGVEAVGAARRQRFDIALVDLDMPHMDGAQAISRLARLTPATRRVLMTASQDADRVGAALRNGAQAYLRKPFTLKALEAILVEVASTSETRARAAVPA